MAKQVVILVGISLLTGLPCTADVIYVKQGGTGSGTSWADAYGDLQDGLDNADPNYVIWVAEGTYYPTYDYELGIGNRGKHFRMKNGVAIYGGFPNTGDSDMADRGPNLYETILTGDLLGNDDPNTPLEDLLNDPYRADNCYHVFYHPSGTNLDETAILDGFTITAGKADGSGNHDSGGGMYNYQSSPTVTYCTFVGNSAGAGGGMWNRGASPKVSNCTFIDNSASAGGGMNNYNSRPILTDCIFTGNSVNGRGGGMRNRYSDPNITDCIFIGNSSLSGGGMLNEDSSPTVTGCTFTGNSAYIWAGGGMYNFWGCKPKVANCTFTGNSAAHNGGGMYNENASPTVTDCTFTGNKAYNRYGGGMGNWASSPTLTGCIFIGNTANYDGGGMNNEGSSPTVISCTFIGNSASDGGGMCNSDVYSSGPYVINCIFNGNRASWGGGICNMGSDPNVTNCIFSGNEVTNGGGGIYNSHSKPTVTNCTFTSNSADSGGGIHNYGNSDPNVTNCILWDNTASYGDEIYNTSSTSNPLISYCDIGGCGGSGGSWDTALGSDEGGNIDANPLFVDPNGTDDIIGTDDDNLRLLAGSPCIDAADGNVALATDISGKSRFDDPNTPNTGVGDPNYVDMGAYEFRGTCGDLEYPYPVGDMNSDCQVDITDAVIMALAWLSEDGGDRWNPACNLYNSDSIIDASDFAVMGRHWLECTKPECD